MTRLFGGALVIGLLASAASPAPRSPEAGECLRLLDAATSGVEAALRVFESRKPDTASAITAANEVVILARRARSELEDAHVSSACAYPRSEELIYLNHLIPGFEGWLAARRRRPPVEYELSSIIRRARAHRERGRERLG